MSTTEINTEVAEATRILAEAISEYGRPVYICKVPIRIQKLVPLAVRKELLATSKLSEGWVRDNDGCFYKGRLDHRSTIHAWAKDHVYHIVTVKEIAEATGAPLHIVREVVGDRADIFRPSEGRTYEVRDPQADRKVEKEAKEKK